MTGKTRGNCVTSICILVLAVLLAGMPHGALAQPPLDPEVATAGGWSPITAIPGYDPDALPPNLIVDNNHTIHAFASLPLSDDPTDPASEELAITYRQWTEQGGWTKPNDIMLTPLKKQARVKDVFMDDAGVMHMIFYGGDEQDANIYYVSAPATDAYSAHAWSEPLPIGPGAIAPEEATIVGDDNGHLMVMYGGDLGEGHSLYTVYSDDAGVTWSDPQLLFSSYRSDNWVSYLYTYRGASGQVYAMWNTRDQSGQNLDGYYARMDNLADKKWSKPEIVVPSVGLGFATPSVFEFNGDVMRFFNNGVEGQVAPTLWFQLSRDGGRTFSEPIIAWPEQIGRNGAVTFAVDSNGTLHGFFAARIAGGFDGTRDLHALWQSIWQNGTWSTATRVVSGPPSESYDPGDPRAVISQGNLILVVYRTDPGKKIGNTWFTYEKLDTPELAVTPLPTPAYFTTSTGAVALVDVQAAIAESSQANGAAPDNLLPTPTPVPMTSTPDLRPDLSQFSKEPGAIDGASPAGPLLGAIVPTALFVVAALIFGSFRRHKS
jgi:hypothetical protein